VTSAEKAIPIGWRKALEKYADRIGARVDDAPPLTPAQRSRLAAIIASGRPVSVRRTRRVRRPQTVSRTEPEKN
jgi:hypothetical protein